MATSHENLTEQVEEGEIEGEIISPSKDDSDSVKQPEEIDEPNSDKAIPSVMEKSESLEVAGQR